MKKEVPAASKRFAAVLTGCINMSWRVSWKDKNEKGNMKKEKMRGKKNGSRGRVK